MIRKFLIVALLSITLTGLRAQQSDYPFQVSVVGTGEPVLLLPGFSCPGEVWEETVSRLREQYECHVFTFAGFGGVEPVDFPWFPRLRDGILSYMEAHDLTGARLVGHSMGGTLALWIAISDRAQPQRVVVVDGLPATGALMIPDYDPENIRYNSPWNERILGMDAAEFEAMARGMASGMCSDTTGQNRIAGWILESDRKTYVYGYTDLLKLDLREALDQVTVPVHILGATLPYGEAAARQTFEDQYARLSDYTLTFAPDSSHFIMFDQPQWFLSQVEEILR